MYLKNCFMAPYLQVIFSLGFFLPYATRPGHQNWVLMFPCFFSPIRLKIPQKWETSLCMLNKWENGKQRGNVLHVVTKWITESLKYNLNFLNQQEDLMSSGLCCADTAIVLLLVKLVWTLLAGCTVVSVKPSSLTYNLCFQACIW